MTNLERHLSVSVDELAKQSIYVSSIPDYDEGMDGEIYKVCDIDEYNSTLHNVKTYDYEEQLEYTINWLKSEEGYETLGCEMCSGRDPNSCNYGYTEICEKCMWYPWNDVDSPKYKDMWKRKDTV